MRRPVRLIAGLVGIVSPLVACSLVVDTSGLGDGAVTAGDATSDVATEGARAGDDAGVDATADATTDGATEGGAKCVDGPTRFCDDFDSPFPGSKWTTTTKKRGDVRFEDVGLSPPRAMHATLTAGNGYGSAQLVTTLAGNPPAVHCELDMKLDGILPIGETDVLSFTTQNGDLETHSVYFASFTGTWMLAEYANATDAGPALDNTIGLGAGLPNATWFHVTFDVSPSSASITANGASIKLSGLTTPAATAHWLHVGMPFTTSDVQAGGIYVDNVDCTSVP